MAAVLGSAFVIKGEWATVGLLRDNMFESLFCLLLGYVHSLLPCAQFPWVHQYFGVG